MSRTISAFESSPPLRLVTQVYQRFLVIGFTLIPAYLIAYLYYFQNPALKFENHLFHEIAIAIATIEGVFIAYVTWRCYRSSGEPLLRWLTLGFLGFTMIYVLHGAFTGFAHSNMWLFLLYGPASRFVMSVLLFVGQLAYYQPVDTPEERMAIRPWLIWVTVFVLIDAAVALIATSPIAGDASVRLSMEGGALFFCGLNVAGLLLRQIRSPLMVIYAVSVSLFALASLAFILGLPWNHMWWLAHSIFAAGFFLLSYGVVQAFRTTRSFATIYSNDELMTRLTEEVAKSQACLNELRQTNHKLEYLATTDPLTGAGNRRQFMERIIAAIALSKRASTPFCLLALDLDHFKSVNDAFGHHVGDAVLRGFVQRCLNTLRPYDYIARIGGEEFMVLLPATKHEAGCMVGERLRSAIAGSAVDAGIQPPIAITISIGAAEFGRDGDTLERIMRVADQRLYRAKDEGRNCMIAA